MPTKFGLLTAAAGAIVLAVAGGTAAVGAEAIKVVSWGGAYTKSQVEAFHKPFSAKTGVQVQSIDYNGGLAEIKAQQDTKNVSWDVVDLLPSDAIRGCAEGYFEKIDPAKLPAAPDGTPAAKDFVPGTLTECAVGNIVWSTIVAYDKTKFKDAVPKTIADFFDVKKFPQKRGMQKVPQNNLEWALIADGVPAKDVYKVLGTKEGVDRAFKKLDTIKPHVSVWWTAGAQPPELLASGEVALTTAYNGRIFDAVQSENKPFVIVWDHQIWQYDLFAIPKGAPNKDKALEFVKFATGSQALAGSASWISYGPARKSAIALVGKHWKTGADMKPHMPTAPENFKTAIAQNIEFWADHQDELNQRFSAWLAK
jgi:putative spermidine/putrescine transport system substrate-binding protein